MKLKYPLFLRAYNSPFKPPKLKWYFGKTKITVPYFLPRKWIPLTEQEAIEKAKDSKLNFLHATFEESVEYYKKCHKTIPKKIGFDFIGLGWKTKFDEYRHEFNPVWSFVFFGYQIAVTFVAVESAHYWEVFLYYWFETDKSKSREERIKQCKEKYSCIWTTYYQGEKTTVDYYEIVLKKNYVKG